MIRVACTFCGSRVPRDATTCVRCGAPPPASFFEEDETPTWGEFREAIDGISNLYLRTPPPSLDAFLTSREWIITHRVERYRLQERMTSTYFDVPRYGILVHLAIRPISDLVGSFRLIVNGSMLMITMPLVAFPIGMTLNLNLARVVNARIEIENFAPSDKERSIDYAMTLLVPQPR